MKQLCLVILPFLFFLPYSYGQGVGVDSLNILLEKETSVDEQIQIYVELAKHSQDQDEAYKYLDNAIGLTDELSRKARIESIYDIAYIYYRQKNFPRAIELFKECIEYWEGVGKREELAKTHLAIGKVYRKSLLINEAIESFKVSSEYFRSIGDVKNVVITLNRIGILYKDRENYSEALKLYHEAFELARKKGLTKQLASSSINIGVVLKKQENYEEALEYYKRALDIYEIETDHMGLANTYNNIGNVYRLQKKYKKALNNYEWSISNRMKCEDTRRISYAYNNIGLIHFEEKKYDLALEYYKKSEQMKIEFEDYEMLTGTYLNMAEVYLTLNNEKQFYYYSDLTEKLARKYNQFDILRKSSVLSGDFESRKGNYKKAYSHLSRVFESLDTLDDQSQKILTSVLQAHFKDRQSQSELDELYEVNDSLYTENEELEKSQSLFFKLVWALSILMVILIVTSLLLFMKQRAFAAKSKELEDTNDQLRETMIGKEEKETLLKEIHHRVKNNLQIIKSLIRLQKSGKDEKMTNILLEFEQRVSSMALVHESLYKSGDLAKVDVTEYYEDLITDLITAYNLEQEVETQISIDIENLGIDTLVPLGLLTNEIISNSLKHGFDAKSNGIIKVDLKKLDDEYFLLYIGDNGKGFDFEKEMMNSNSLGGELIEALVEQLDGEYKFISEDGAYYHIKFKTQDKKATK